MKLSDVLPDYLHFLVYEQGVTEASRSTYAAHVRRFLRWLEAEGGYPEPTEQAFTLPVLRRFSYSLGKQGLRPRSIRGMFNGLRSFGKYLHANGILETNPAQEIGMPKRDAAVRTVCTDQEAALLLEGCDRLANQRRSALAKAVVSTFIFCGLRRSEALSLHVRDINLQECSVTVRSGKGGKYRVVFSCEEWRQAVGEWLAIREQGERPVDWLFLENRSRRLYHDGLKELFDEVKAAGGLKARQDLTPHCLRHGYATRLLRQKVDLKTIQDNLGHAHLQTTAVYLHGSQEHQKETAHLASLSTGNKTPEPQPITRNERRRIALQR